MKHFHKKRILKLCDFLEQLPRKRFDFGVVAEKQSCGTVGCAIGWTPEVFPRLVKWTPPTTKHGQMGIAPKDGRRGRCYTTIARSLFGLTKKHAHDLFTPSAPVFIDLSGAPDYKYVVLGSLDFDATPKQVAKRLRKFLRLMEQSSA